nr:hypothetical protein CFP56_44641 [Quercus suber]
MLGDCLFPTNSYIQNWASRQGGRIIDNLKQALLLPDDMQYFVEGSAEAISVKLKWHTIAAAQMTHMLEGQLKGAVEEAKKERALKEVESVISARDMEVADLKVAMVQSEDKFYNMGFADAKNSSEPIMLESQHYGFREGWMAAVNALDPTQNKEEDSLSMRQLVGEIDSYTEVIELDILSNPTIAEGQMPQSTLSNPNPQMVTCVPPNPSEHALNPEA